MGAFNQRVLGMTTTAVIVESFSTEWIEINEYLNKYNTLSCNKKYALLVSTRWMMGLCQHCLCISLCMQREGNKGPNVSQLQELYFTWCAIEMQYLNLKNQSTASQKCFCLQASSCCLKHSFIWAFWSFTYWQDRLRWVTFLLKIWVS